MKDAAETLQALEGKATVKTDRRNSSTIYLIEGSLKAVLAEIQGLFERYHPLGYGTSVDMIQATGSIYVARVFRMNSCD